MIFQVKLPEGNQIGTATLSSWKPHGGQAWVQAEARQCEWLSCGPPSTFNARMNPHGLGGVDPKSRTARIHGFQHFLWPQNEFYEKQTIDFLMNFGGRSGHHQQHHSHHSGCCPVHCLGVGLGTGRAWPEGWVAPGFDFRKHGDEMRWWSMGMCRNLG